MKKIVAVVMVSILILGSFTFAAQDRRPSPEQEERFIGLLESYYPEGLERFEANHEAHKEVHEALGEYRHDRQEKRDELRSFLDEKKKEFGEKVEAGDMTREEAKKAFDEFLKEFVDKGAVKDHKETFDAFKKIGDQQHEERKALHDALKTAIENEDAEEISKVLQEIITHQEAHLQLDLDRLAYIESLKEEN